MDTMDIADQLKLRKKTLLSELARVDKALSALEPDHGPKKPRAQRASAPPPVEGEGPKPVTREDVLRVCTGEFCTAEKVSTLLGCPSTKAAQILSALFGQSKMIREGERGGYSYRTKEEQKAEAGNGQGVSPFSGS